MLDKTTLSQFIGTEAYHRWSLLFPRHVLTDGAKYVADNGGQSGAYWLMDAIASYDRHPKMTQKLRDFQFWKLTRSGNTATLVCTDGNSDKAKITQKIPFTDFDLDEITLWVQQSGNMTVIHLPSEY
jgi:hypothetical protein